MKVNDYVRTENGYIYKIECIEPFNEPSVDIGLGFLKEVKGIWIDKLHLHYIEGSEKYKSSPNILELLEPQDLLYIDIDNGYEGGIIVPRIPETQNELNKMIELIKNGTWILKDVVTYEQLKNCKYRVI